MGKTNGNPLYIDEGNLLDDHVVDVFAGRGGIGPERGDAGEGDVPAPVAGSSGGNDEPGGGGASSAAVGPFQVVRGDLRGEGDLAAEAIVDRVLSFESEEPGFLEEWAEKDAALRGRIVSARRKLPRIRVSDGILQAVVEVDSESGVAGHRGDITILKSAKALAAFKGIDLPDEECLTEAFRMLLPHRLKEDPFEETATGRKRLDGAPSRFGVQKQGR
jgi:magnesium chelatase subunit I